MILDKELQQLGLSDKEAKVYLASLGLGPSPAQAIAEKAGLKRPTAYYAIEELAKKGLMSSAEQGKKRFFSAESPERLISIIAAQKKQAQALEDGLHNILPELNNIFGSIGEHPKVRFFEGKEGIRAVQEDFLAGRVKSLENIYPRDDFIKVFSQKEREEYVAKRKKKKIKVRTIYTSQNPPALLTGEALVERKFIPYDKFPFSADITIYGDKVAICTYKGKLIGIIIESKEIAETLRMVFNLAWLAAK